MGNPQFNPDDVKKLAQFVIERAIQETEYGRNSYHECQCCGGQVWVQQDPNLIQHKPDCEYLIAKDLLTGL